MCRILRARRTFWLRQDLDPLREQHVANDEAVALHALAHIFLEHPVVEGRPFLAPQHEAAPPPSPAKPPRARSCCRVPKGPRTTAPVRPSTRCGRSSLLLTTSPYKFDNRRSGRRPLSRPPRRCGSMPLAFRPIDRNIIAGRHRRAPCCRVYAPLWRLHVERREFLPVPIPASRAILASAFWTVGDFARPCWPCARRSACSLAATRPPPQLGAALAPLLTRWLVGVDALWERWSRSRPSRG